MGILAPKERMSVVFLNRRQRKESGDLCPRNSICEGTLKTKSKPQFKIVEIEGLGDHRGEFMYAPINHDELATFQQILLETVEPDARWSSEHTFTVFNRGEATDPEKYMIFDSNEFMAIDSRRRLTSLERIIRGAQQFEELKRSQGLM